MEKNEIREALKHGGQWLGAARNWLLWHKDPGGQLTWGSVEEVRLTVKEIEELALAVATAVMHETQDLFKAKEQARAIRNVQRAVERNENREINMGEAWALIKEAVAEPKLTK